MQVVRLFGQLDVGADVTWEHPKHPAKTTGRVDGVR